ncbi:MAG TPA: efflux RND transporter periplasmic adaptor subunit [Xanthobacteraceae bacterium]|nr:efflux RND transporter periplasmic adaptor subunit [Xanthobacteraceae bacterium]
MRRIGIIGLLGLAVVAAVVAAMSWRNGEWGRGQAVAQDQRAPGAARGASAGVPVETSSARTAKTSTDIQAVGSLRSDESVKIAPEIAGRVAEIAFKEGEEVKQGDVLVRLDEALAQAEVDDAKARMELAKANYDRATRLARSGSGTERAQDEATAAFETARVALELARVRLAKHTITAPFPGVMGLRTVSVGAFINVGAELVNLEKIDALKVDFKVPEIYLAQISVGQHVEVTVDALPDRTFNGKIYAIDPLVDINGRALHIRARLPNPDRVLRPGLFARITIKGMKEEEVVVVPESAIVPRGGDTFIYRIENGKAVEARVRLGQRKNGNVEVVEGLAPDSMVVTAGHQRLRDGAAVEVVGPSEARG